MNNGMKQRPLLTRGLLGLTLVGLLTFAGCGASEEEAQMASAPQSMAVGAVAPIANEASDKAAFAGAPDSPAAATAQLVQAATTIPRKIIYNATVELVSDNFSTAQQSLLLLVKTHRGYIGETNVTGTTGAPRQGTWKIRIPADQFDMFMAAVAKLGELQTTHTDSQDVTAEFYDLQARISNKQVEEKRLIEHLESFHRQTQRHFSRRKRTQPCARRNRTNARSFAPAGESDFADHCHGDNPRSKRLCAAQTGHVRNANRAHVCGIAGATRRLWQRHHFACCRACALVCCSWCCRYSSVAIGAQAKEKSVTDIIMLGVSPIARCSL